MGKIRIGVGGWTFEPWRDTFYPKDVTQKRELEYMASRLPTTEVNGTYYRSQTPATFRKWHDETPENFVFSLKAPRFATNRKILAEAGESIQRFIDSGLTELGDKLGAINWQFMATKKFDPVDFGAFLKLLPAKAGGRALRHAVEVRHDSFGDDAFFDMARDAGVAVIHAADGEFPEFDRQTADFSYLRIMGTAADHKEGYSKGALDKWAAKAIELAKKGDVYLYVISGHKELNPAAALALNERVKE